MLPGESPQFGTFKKFIFLQDDENKHYIYGGKPVAASLTKCVPFVCDARKNSPN
jgi:hypothetical protein